MGPENPVLIFDLTTEDYPEPKLVTELTVEGATLVSVFIYNTPEGGSNPEVVEMVSLLVSL